MATVKIMIDSKDIVVSGSVVFSNEEVFKVYIDNLVFHFYMKKSENEESEKIKLEKISENTLGVAFLNFNDTMQIGNAEQLKIGTLNFKDLFLNFRMTSISNARILYYTFFLGV